MTKCRISNHNLVIESSRYRGLQAIDIICNLCIKDVEDELHFLLKCSSLESERVSIISNINSLRDKFAIPLSAKVVTLIFGVKMKLITWLVLVP